MYRIMFSDLDETLLVHHHVPEFNRQAIKEARKKGLKFVPCTGRAFNMIPEILKEIDAYDKEGEYSLCFNGGLIVENKNSKVLHFKGLDFDIAQEIFHFGEHLDVCVMVFTLDCCYLFHADES
ncbi:MAG: HAD family hydrolase, partial [Faecalibacillus sp.]